jgi:glycosyltransferase involved in cell wall biosynthesis
MWRVAYITNFASLYGANRSMLDLVTELRGTGVVEPYVILPEEGPLTERLDAERIPWAVFPFQSWMAPRWYGGRIHHRMHQYWGYERAARERAAENHALLPSVETRVRAWGIDLVHANSATVALAVPLARNCGRPLVWHIRELPERQYLFHLDVGRRAYGKALRQADRLIAISQAVAADIRTYAGTGTPVQVIPNGVLKRDWYKALQAESGARWAQVRPFRFALVGLIHPSKGQEEAIRAIGLLHKQGREVELVIAGGGNTAPLEQLAQQCGARQAVDFAGYVDSPFPIFHRAHAALMCSRNEAMGRVTVEAMASGLPVIGHASGGTVELLEDWRNGLLYPGGAEALAGRMRQLMDDPAWARRIGDQAALDAESRYSVEHNAQQVRQVYASLSLPRA